MATLRIETSKLNSNGRGAAILVQLSDHRGPEGIERQAYILKLSQRTYASASRHSKYSVEWVYLNPITKASRGEASDLLEVDTKSHGSWDDVYVRSCNRSMARQARIEKQHCDFASRLKSWSVGNGGSPRELTL